MVRKGEKSSAYFLIDLPDLGCYHVPGQAWVPLLNWGWLTQPGRVPLVDPFKDLLSPPFWLGQSPVWHRGLKGFEGKVQLASTSPGAGDPSSSLVPERAAS